jgi:hypothetical protein
LGAAFAVADINKNQAAKIAAGMDPAGQGDHLPDVRRAQFIAMMRAFHVKIFGRVGVSPTQIFRDGVTPSLHQSKRAWWRRKRLISKRFLI